MTTRGHGDLLLPFKPRNSGGGSEKGKPQAYWPVWMKVAADAIHVSYKGGMDRAVECRRFMPMKDWKLALDTLIPGWRDHAALVQGPRSTDYAKLLKNRVQVMYWERGAPSSLRAAISDEHWHHYVPSGHPLRALHGDIWRGRIRVITDWRTTWAKEDLA